MKIERVFDHQTPDGRTLHIADAVPPDLAALANANDKMLVPDLAMTAQVLGLGRQLNAPVSYLLDIGQPYECEVRKCGMCGLKLRAQHHHCCGMHMHVHQNKSACIFRHWMTPGRHVPLSPQMEPLLEWDGKGDFHLAYRKEYCERPGCTVTSMNGIGLHVDHKDGNHGNNRVENLWTLCPKCHHWKSRALGDYRRKYAA